MSSPPNSREDTQKRLIAHVKGLVNRYFLPTTMSIDFERATGLPLPEDMWYLHLNSTSLTEVDKTGKRDKAIRLSQKRHKAVQTGIEQYPKSFFSGVTAACETDEVRRYLGQPEAWEISYRVMKVQIGRVLLDRVLSLNIEGFRRMNQKTDPDTTARWGAMEEKIEERYKAQFNNLFKRFGVSHPELSTDVIRAYTGFLEELRRLSFRRTSRNDQIRDVAQTNVGKLLTFARVHLESIMTAEEKDLESEHEPITRVSSFETVMSAASSNLPTDLGWTDDRQNPEYTWESNSFAASPSISYSELQPRNLPTSVASLTLENTPATLDLQMSRLSISPSAAPGALSAKALGKKPMR